jgi:N-acylneuraminate cytidylyltransferase
MNYLFLIPARGGSKGIPHKNIKDLNGKPLIQYSIDVARYFTSDDNICVSSDDDKIIEVVEDYGLRVPFKRPACLATDKVGSSDVILHAIKYYLEIGKSFDALVLLQPTSPLRRPLDVENCLKMFSENCDMVVSVKKVSTNPFYNCYKENEDGYLYKLFPSKSILRRQDAPDLYEFNGAVYVINIESLLKCSLSDFSRIKYYLMDEVHSLDIDSFYDFNIANYILSNNLF